MSASGCGDPRAFPRPDACPRQMVHDRHSLPCPQRQGGGDGRGPRRGLAMVPRNRRQRAQPYHQPPERRTDTPPGLLARTADLGYGPDGDRHPGDLPAPRQTYYGADPDLGRETSRAVNDFIAEICGRYPDRFVGLGTVPFQAPDLAIAELDRLHKSLGFHGIEIMTHVAGEDLSAERFRKIFARCEELGLVVFMHPDGFTEARRLGDHYFNNVIGNPLDSTVALHHLIFGGVLSDNPNLKLVVAHGGGFLPAYSGRIDHAAAARPDCCERINRMPSTYLKRVYFDALVYTHHQLDYLVEQYGADHILMGTDYPADMGEVDPIGMIEGAPGLDDVERRAILGRNAARLLNLEVPVNSR